jgi:CubicO group peptidase (beta-lactamase class C family)
LVAFATWGAVLAAQPSTGPAPATPVALAPQAGPDIAPPAAKGDAHELTADDLRTFLDGFMPYALHRGDIAGATVAVVKDGKLLFAQGFGYADLKTKKPVVADETLFRPGSVSKLFTWTSVMQLVEQKKLDLDADINTYLDFKVPEAFGKPITLRNIMTHTSGFEESITDLFVLKPEQLYPLHDYILKRMPERIFEPGKVVAYSNFATTIAGYIVQRVSGEKFEDYIANHIFKPLGMAHASFVQPLPAALQGGMSVGYKQASDPTPVPYELVEPSPAGALAATSTDMAKFMIAQLADGGTLLKPGTAHAMHSRNYTLAPGLLNGMDLGFYDENRNGHRIIGHAGDTTAFHSDLHLILDANTGLFVSFNSLGKEGAAGEVRTSLFRAFLDRYFPYTAPEQKTVTDPKPDNARVAGFYTASRRKDSALRLLFSLGQTEVAPQPDGTITVSAFKDASGAVKKWREVAPLDYREVGGQTHLRFVTTPDGAIDYLASDDFIPVELIQRVNGLMQLNLLKLFGLGTIAVCLLTLAIWFGGWIARRRFKRPLAMTRGQARLRLASRLGAILYLAVIFGWIGLVVAVSADESLLLAGALVSTMTVLYAIGALALLGGLAMVANGVLRAAQGPGGWLARLGDVVLGLAGAYGIWAILAFGLANFHTNI